jgi:hypothetical protein
MALPPCLPTAKGGGEETQTRIRFFNLEIVLVSQHPA